jgi:hypothetical protein
MWEILMVLALAGLMWGAHFAASLDPELLLFGGAWLVGAGFALGLPTGFVYHVALYRSLRRIDALPAQWWLKPTALHGRIPAGDRVWVLGWCYAGAFGLFVILVGIPIGAMGAWRL